MGKINQRIGWPFCPKLPLRDEHKVMQYWHACSNHVMPTLIVGIRYQ